jgi:hypothetical protein
VPKKTLRRKVYVPRRAKVATQRATRRARKVPLGDREERPHDPLELLLAEVEAMREEVGCIAAYLKSGACAVARSK